VCALALYDALGKKKKEKFIRNQKISAAYLLCPAEPSKPGFNEADTTIVFFWDPLKGKKQRENVSIAMQS
jgi:hypothetical protein